PISHGDRESDSPITTAEVTDSILQGLLEDLSKDRLALPTPRGIAQHIINIVTRPVVDRDVIAEAIVLDPALTAQVLRIANSAFYERAGEVLSINEAVALMGSQTVGNVVSLLSISQINEARLDASFQEQLRASWRTARQVSHLSSIVASGAGVDAHLARVVGLVHNLGTLAMGVWAEQIPHLANNATRVARVAKRLRHAATIRIFEQWQVSEQLVCALDEFASLRSPPQRAPVLSDCVAAAWLLVQHPDTSAFLASDAMRAGPIEKLGLDEAIVFDLMAERAALDSVLDAQLGTHID
ncbi:MAG: HD-like signal output (HDOD) protein, partial [Gammaproteobacteria bacterium]